ncbi:helix-hairpin-helix domain-containing protein [Alteribacter keqinensis]|uniref:ComEA family DNA-binding protein n=1 Tax=Alteribacter keqinensis TaxID=2483800 RepID=A0A3M7TTS1_9BACI|nr:helix-hairpin-helix domain-containing protein [Alteribacter keqinensis]RNA68843.1 ComEA family DNA-binding protein [Alteribacter keqinensis]
MTVLQKYRQYLPYAVGGLAVFIFILYHAIPQESQTALSEDKELEFTSPETEENEIVISSEVYVDVKGAVFKPGVYMLEEGMRVKDALLKAGGVRPEADQNRVNLALMLQDEMVIYVPEEGEEGQGDFGGSASQESDQVNLNTADLSELESLPGIGPSKAQAIIAHREDHGSFQNIEDLTNVTGIGEKTLENLKPYLRVN